MIKMIKIIKVIHHEWINIMLVWNGIKSIVDDSEWILEQ